MFVGRSRGGRCVMKALLAGMLAVALVAAIGAGEATAGTMTDLGVLPNGLNSGGTAINNFGQVAGYAQVFGINHAFRWTSTGGMQDLGLIDFGANPTAMNQLGQISGWGKASKLCSAEPFRWTEATGLQDIGNLGTTDVCAANYSLLTDNFLVTINDLGQVAGTSGTSMGVVRAFRWTPADGMEDLGTLGGASSSAVGINDLGEVAGVAQVTSGSVHAFLWTARGGMRDLGTLPGGTYSVATAVNAFGLVAGIADTSSEATDAFRWTPSGGMQDLGPVGEYGSVTAINALGQVAGNISGFVGGNAYGGAFRWTAVGGLQDLGGFTVRAMNDLGAVIGDGLTIDGADHAFLWTTSKGTQDLGTLGGVNSVPLGINDLGQVTGYAGTADGYEHAFLWTP